VNIYVLRHASAGTRRLNPLIDTKRPLDKEGKQQCILVGNYLNALHVQFDLVISSPLKRALQTASFVGTETGYDGHIQISEALLPSAAVKDFEALVGSLNGHENVLMVGHNPNLPVLLSSLLGSKINIRLRKGAIARVECTRRPGTLHWLVDPRILRGAYASVTKSSRRKTSRK
jgi:phosphohistidine phosphatase